MMYVDGIMGSVSKRSGLREGGLAGSAVGGWNADGKLTWGWSLAVVVLLATMDWLSTTATPMSCWRCRSIGRLGLLQGGDKVVCKQGTATSE